MFILSRRFLVSEERHTGCVFRLVRVLVLWNGI
jgi:hypothetical protein